MSLPLGVEVVRRGVYLLRRKDKTFIIVATAHIGTRSAEDVKQAIEEYRPNDVALELDARRFDAIVHPEKLRELDLLQVIRSGEAANLMTRLLMMVSQRQMGALLKTEPGQEFRQAHLSAEAIGARLALVDRDINITFRRFLARSRWYERMTFLSSLLFGILAGPFAMRRALGGEISDERVDELRELDLTTMLIEILGRSPAAREVILDERDTIMASGIAALEGPVILSVVGSAHTPGTLAGIVNGADAVGLSDVPKPGLGRRLLPWVLSAVPSLSIVAVALWMGMTKAKAVAATALVSGALGSAFGCVLFGAHPFTILAALVLSPLIMIMPVPGLNAAIGFIEAWLRRPTVREMESIPDDAMSVRGWRRNGALRPLGLMPTLKLLRYLAVAASLQLFM